MLKSLAGLAEKSIVYLDTETSGLDPYTSKLLLVQLAAPGCEPTVMEFGKLSEAEKTDLREFLLPQDRVREVVAHNAAFDLRFLEVHLGLRIEAMKVFDTQVAEAVLCAGKAPHLRSYTSLATTLHRRFGLSLDKGIRDQFIGHDGSYFSPEQLAYAAEDVAHLGELRRVQIEEARTYGLEKVLRLEFELVKHVTRMHLNGVSVDVDLWREILKATFAEREEVKTKVYSLAEEYFLQETLFEALPFNLGSNAQTLGFLRKNVGLDIEDTMERSLQETGHPLCMAILDYREQDKLLSSFGESTLAKLNPVTGRLHPEFNQTATATGRFSCDSPNVQTIPSKGAGKRLRECFVAPSGKKIVCADYSQIELRILAELSGEPKLLEAYEDSIDIHAQTTSIAFGIPVGEVSSEQRKVGKIVSFAVVYGGGPAAVSKAMLQMVSHEDAEDMLFDGFGKRPSEKGPHYDLAREFIKSYLANMPKAQEYLETSGMNAVMNRYSETLLGRKRFYFELDNQELQKDIDEWQKTLGSVQRRGKNHPIQGTAADIMKTAMVRLGERIVARPEWGAKMLMQVHDEIVCEVDEEHAEAFKTAVEEAMVMAGEEFMVKVPVEVDCQISDHWEH